MTIANYSRKDDLENSPELSPWWTVKMASRHMNISVDRVRILVKQGRIAKMSAGTKMLLLSRDDIRHFQKHAGGRPSRSKEQQRDFEDWLMFGSYSSWMLNCPPSLMPGPCCVCGKSVGTVLVWKDGQGEGRVDTTRVAVKHYPKVPIVKVLATGKRVKARCPGSGKVPRGWRDRETPVGNF